MRRRRALGQYASVAPPLSLSPLTLSSSSFTRGITTSGTIIGSTIGSSIVGSGLPSGLTINGVARTWAWDGSGSGAASGNLTLTETLASALLSPRDSTISYSIAAAGSLLGRFLFNSSPQSGLLVLLEDI